MPAPATPAKAPPDDPPGAASRSTRLLVAAAVLLAAGLGVLTAPARLPVDAGASVAVASTTLIDLNTATAAELGLLPRIGPKLAARIVQDRTDNGPFESVDALVRVKGIGPRTIIRLRPHATAE